MAILAIHFCYPKTNAVDELIHKQSISIWQPQSPHQWAIVQMYVKPTSVRHYILASVSKCFYALGTQQHVSCMGMNVYWFFSAC